MNTYINFINNVPNWKQPRYPSVDEWINKLAYTYSEILFSDLKNGVLSH